MTNFERCWNWHAKMETDPTEEEKKASKAQTNCQRRWDLMLKLKKEGLIYLLVKNNCYV